MRYFLIAILLLLFFSSFKTIQPEDVSDSQLVMSDSCRLSKIYYDGKLQTEYHYNKMKKVTRINHIGYNLKHRKGKTTFYNDYKYDQQNRMHEILFYQFRNSLDGSEGNFALIRKTVFIYSGNLDLVSEVRIYHPNFKDPSKEHILSGISEHTYNSKNQLVKIQPVQIKKKRRKKIRKILPYWYEYKYDSNNNPTIAENYKIKNEQPVLLKIIVNEYDSSPNLLTLFDFPLRINNVIKRKISSLRNNEWEVSEYEADFQYNDQGFISNKRIEKKIYEYEYTCD